MLEVERRDAPSALADLAAILLALAITIGIGAVMFAALGVDAWRALGLFFITPLESSRAWGELSVKVVPLLLIGVGLAVAFRANVWNIGAEGQFMLGSICATGVALRTTDSSSSLAWLGVVFAGAVGGALWAALAAFLRDRFNTNEILVSLMLVYVAEQAVGCLVYGPWKDPSGYNFPQTATFPGPARIPRLFTQGRANWGLPLALVVAAGVWVFLNRSYAGYKLAVGGASASAARYAGFSSRSALWVAFSISGALAGMAGALEVAGPAGQLTQHLAVGYGFAAIIVAFLGRLNPFGVCFAAVLMSMFYIGGELSQSRLGLPLAITGVFQGVLLFALLGCERLARYKVRLRLASHLAAVGSQGTLGAVREVSARSEPKEHGA